MPAPKNALSNEATDVDLAVYDALTPLGWKRGTRCSTSRATR